jgi:hypothetical protein
MEIAECIERVIHAEPRLTLTDDRYYTGGSWHESKGAAGELISTMPLPGTPEQWIEFFRALVTPLITSVLWSTGADRNAQMGVPHIQALRRALDHSFANSFGTVVGSMAQDYAQRCVRGMHAELDRIEATLQGCNEPGRQLEGHEGR